jgi:hypothetical protein
MILPLGKNINRWGVSSVFAKRVFGNFALTAGSAGPQGKNGPSFFFEGPICLGSLWLGEFFASTILSRDLAKFWVVGKPLGLGFTSQRFLSIFFD